MAFKLYEIKSCLLPNFPFLQAIMFFVRFILFISRFTIVNPSVQAPRSGQSKICWFLVFAATIVGATAEVAQGQGLKPRGAERPSFDCAQAKTAATRLICADGELARLDGELGAVFSRQKVKLGDADQSALVAEQRLWINDRNARCGLNGKDTVAIEVLTESKLCLMQIIRGRIVALNSATQLEPSDIKIKEAFPQKLAQSHAGSDASIQEQLNILGTSAMMLYVLVNCHELRQEEAVILIDAQLAKLKGIEPSLLVVTISRAKSQAQIKANQRVCAGLDQQLVFGIKLAVREEKQRIAEKNNQKQLIQPAPAKHRPYDDIYYNEIKERRLKEMEEQIRILYFAIGCEVLDEERIARGILSTKEALIWPEMGDPLLKLDQPNQVVGGQYLFDGIPPEIVNARFMNARRAGLSAAGANPDAPVVREFRTGVPAPPGAIPLYSGPSGKNCAYWLDHPRNVVAVRQLANFLNLRASGGLEGYR